MANEIKQSTLGYAHDELQFEGQLFTHADQKTRPGILVAPAFGGLGPLEIDYARRLADLGYVTLAVDYYGDAARVETQPEAYALMRAVEADRPVLAKRMQAAMTALQAQSDVEDGRIGAMGFCFGGKAVLDLARSGAPIKACVPIHGVYDAPPDPAQAMPGSVLVLHGWDDPLATPEQLTALAAELTVVCDDWQVLGFGGTGHAFTNPGAQSHDAGMGYSARASDRAWTALTKFFDETLNSDG
ncbi:dienelactone hydrolase family protein [Thalassococcus sp. S3]|uniref:dienelactone hydrolase family protein n=1 Tax=Thalassococcus sp. S3 TaxID=2017482 RepID=UPI001024792D|nr:dienelactone hydrolase family protein [Thalassococcus sp. S3]QBF33740.1 carboxymethylenebutenolidase [Thalassococcus sp. S3]